MNNFTKYLVVVTLIVLAIALGSWVYMNRGEEVQVNNFEECYDAGYPVMESYPRQCASPDGRTFTEEVGEIPVDIEVNVEEE